jgi:hypothetical protein
MQGDQGNLLLFAEMNGNAQTTAWSTVVDVAGRD